MKIPPAGTQEKRIKNDDYEFRQDRDRTNIIIDHSDQQWMSLLDVSTITELMENAYFVMSRY